MKKKLILCILILFVIAPPIVHFIVSTPSPVGFISVDKQDVWINFYGALFGGTLTLLGVGWTIEYTENARKADRKKHEQEIAEEFNRRDLETKRNLSAQYKPILTIAFDSNFIEDIEFGLSKYDKVFVQNYVSLDNERNFEQNDKRLVINLSLLNIGRGEASDLTIKSVIITSDGEKWETVTRTYKEICTWSGINVEFCKMLTEDEWKKYNNKLEKPLLMLFEIDYYDLVGYHHKLRSTVTIGRFIYMLDENKQSIPHVLVLNPYDSKIENETSA